MTLNDQMAKTQPWKHLDVLSTMDICCRNKQIEMGKEKIVEAGVV